jgi:Uma2 family endonuclease
VSIVKTRYATGMTTATGVSVEEYLNTSYDPDCEYVDGEVLERNMGEPDHAGLQGLILMWLGALEKQLGIYVWPEMRVQVAPTRFRVPDIAVTTWKVKGRFLRQAPLLCVEVLSPEDRASRVEIRIDDYLKFGVPHVWMIDPRRRVAWSYTRDARREAVSVLTTREPRIELPIADLFSRLDERLDIEEED